MKNIPRSSHARRRLLLFCLLLTFFSAAQAQTLTGTVSDEKGTKLSNVSVMIKGRSQGTTTGNDGRFTIAAPGNATLVFSFIGYKNQEVAVSGRTTIDVVLTALDRNLDEVVVTALGIRKQSRGLGYSATNVKPEELTINRTANVMNALQGKVAGVN